ncbi:hypothetical protein BaRGS_00021273 [Batillaria attramentaria]|uniref:Outer dynein arm-docking complex subunit 4 n=1 Tax=Batillaria attramentaria TaxID=370345 RepID=A0ABD0KK75_9CAEN
MAQVASPLGGGLTTQKKEMLYDIYKKEAEEFMTERKFSKALQSYNLECRVVTSASLFHAIKLQPKEKSALLGRSKCYLQMGKTYRAMQDAERTLTLDASDLVAVHQKAEILFVTGNHQLALVYYKRGLRLDPDSARFENGRQRTAAALHRFGGGNVAKNKLSSVGDLSFFLNNKMRRSLPKDFDEYDTHYSSGREDLPSAGFRTRDHCPLRRITRKPRFPQLQTLDAILSVGGAEEIPKAELRQPDEETMRKILGELYGDRQYLQRLQSDLPFGKRARRDVNRLAQEGADFLRERTSDRAERELTMLTDEGLEFLRERSVFWDSLGPLPPPVPPRRSLVRERTFGSIASGDLSVNHGMRRRHADPEVAQKDVSQVNFDFRSHLKTRQLESKEEPHVQRGHGLTQQGQGETRGVMRKVSNLLPLNRIKAKAKRSDRTMFVGFDDPEVERRRELAKFINEEMDSIDEAFKTKDYDQCLHKAEVCLHAVSTLSDDDIKKSETLASLHSCIGNASIALRLFDNAFQHHQMALQIGKEEKSNSIIARSLGHMGRMYIIQQKFNKALEVFARKAPMCNSLEEVAQTFHEIGNCFLVLGHFDYARDCGKKSLRAARDADLPFFQQQAWILIAIAEAKLQHLEECNKAFAGALKVAKGKDDIESATAIQGAMEHVSTKMDQILRTKTLVNQRMLMRTKAKTLTREDLPQNVGIRKKPLPPVRKHDPADEKAAEIQDDSCLEQQGVTMERDHASMETRAVANDQADVATERDHVAMETEVAANDQGETASEQGGVDMVTGATAEQLATDVEHGSVAMEADAAALEHGRIVEGRSTADVEQSAYDAELHAESSAGTQQGVPETDRTERIEQSNTEDACINNTDRTAGYFEYADYEQHQAASENQPERFVEGAQVVPTNNGVSVTRITENQTSYQRTPRLASREVSIQSMEKKRASSRPGKIQTRGDSRFREH